MIRLVEKEWSFQTTKEELCTLETSIIRMLDWDLQFPCPLFFLERYQRIFGLDQEKIDVDAARVGNLARKLIRCMLLSSNYLRFKPSHLAATALLLSIGINSSPNAGLMGLPAPKQDLYSRGVYYGLGGGSQASSFMEAARGEAALAQLPSPLLHWNRGVAAVT